MLISEEDSIKNIKIAIEKEGKKVFLQKRTTSFTIIF